jgi:AraC-like DNA-binding protein
MRGTGDVSDISFAFVQLCQTALGVCTYGDFVAQMGAIWSCLCAFPRNGNEAELSTAITAVAQIANGFFAVGAFRHELDSVAPPRAHINSLLLRIRSNYSNRTLTMTAIAESIGVTQSHLSRSLLRHTRFDFATHLNGVRVLAAVDLIASHSLPVAEVATLVGYRSTGELDRQCRRLFGLTPTHVRDLLALAPHRRAHRDEAPDSPQHSTRTADPDIACGNGS